ncbi:MAG: hypothetical protein ABIP93_07235 [Gemmatimonadaceae bacterium]
MHPRPTWRHRLREVVTERLQLKAIALVLAALLWLVVGARQPTEGYVQVKVVPELDSSLVLLDGTQELQALVAGRAADLVKLYATPLLLRRRVGGDAPDTLVLDVTVGDVHVPPELTQSIRVIDVQPRNVTLRFETRASGWVRVENGGRIVIRTHSGVTPARDAEFEPRMVQVTGPRRVVRGLRAIHPFSLSLASGDTLEHVADLDTIGLDVRVQPTQVKVRVRSVSLPAATAASAP